METIVEQYRKFLKQQQREVNTIKSYVHEAESFLGWCAIRSAGISDLSQQTLLDYRDALLERGVKVTTVNKSVSTLSTFFKWGLSVGQFDTNYARRLRLPQARKEDAPRWLTPEEEDRLLEAVSRESTVFQRTRNEALVYAMLYAGVKVEEVPQLLLNAIQDDGLHICDNGKEVRIVPLPEAARAKLDAWLRLRSASKKEVHVLSPMLFVTERSGAMQTRAVQFVIETYSDKLGVPISAQTLRNTFCRRWVERGATIEQLQALAGHKTLLTTWKYFR